MNAENLLRLNYEPDDEWHDGRDVAVSSAVFVFVADAIVKMLQKK